MRFIDVQRCAKWDP